MIRGNIRLYLRAIQNIFQAENLQSVFMEFFHNPLLFGAQRQLNSGVLPTPPVKVLIKDLNQIDMRFYTYSSSRNILRKRKVL
ncbi:MAG: hypothetical protein PHE78_07370 [Candidatus Gastranaerophilales bacterium]|jgi:hypothetical protein|nr:hypothetical protein [Candidatus Gastranaerophilales bacterium]